MPFILLLGLLVANICQARTTELILLPTYAVPTETGWHTDLLAMLYQVDEEETTESLAGKAIRKLYDIPSEGEDRIRFDQRWGPFRADMQEGKTLFLLLENQTMVAMPKTDEYGQTHISISIPGYQNSADTENSETRERWFHFNAVHAPKNIKGQLQLLPKQGLSVISDIDDTIKLTDVRDTKNLIHNTFSKEYQSIPGMAELYRYLSAKGAAFHYVSSSPWQLYRPLSNFLQKERFPQGTLHLFNYRVSVRNVMDIFKSGISKKSLPIERLLQDFPGRTFILIGDSGEQDVELYMQMAERFPGQIIKILIRDIDGDLCKNTHENQRVTYFCEPGMMREKILQ